MRVWYLLVALLLIPMTASAQLGFLDKVFENVTDVSVSPVLGKSIRGGEHITDAGANLALTGVSFEASFGLGEVAGAQPDNELCYTVTYEPTPTTKEETIEGKTREPAGEGGKVTETVVVYSLEKDKKRRFARSDSGRAEFEGDTIAQLALEHSKNPKAKPRPGKHESQWQRWKRACADAPSLLLELAIGYTQLAGYRGDDVNLRGSIEELPSLTLYATLSNGWWLDVYGGLRSGLAQVKGLRSVSHDSVFHAEGSTIQFGLVGPALVFGKPTGNWELFIEPAWTFRKFDTLKWYRGYAAGGTASRARLLQLHALDRRAVRGGRRRLITAIGCSQRRRRYGGRGEAGGVTGGWVTPGRDG
jgi:hypothetical protein